MKTLSSISLLIGLIAFPMSAQIDSGGGKAQVGSLTNHGSLGGTVASGSLQAGAVTNHPALIEVLYAAQISRQKVGSAQGAIQTNIITYY